MPCLSYMIAENCKQYINKHLKFIDNYHNYTNINNLNDKVFTSFYHNLLTSQNFIQGSIQHPDGIFIKDICEELEKCVIYCRDLKKYIYYLNEYDIFDIDNFYNKFINAFKSYNKNLILRLSLKYYENKPFFHVVNDTYIPFTKEYSMQFIKFLEEELNSINNLL